MTGSGTWVEITIRDHLTLVSHLDLSAQGTWWLSQDSLACRTTAPPDGATPSVEEAETYPIAIRHRGEFELSPVEGPVCRHKAALFVAIRVA